MAERQAAKQRLEYQDAEQIRIQFQDEVIVLSSYIPGDSHIKRGVCVSENLNKTESRGSSSFGPLKDRRDWQTDWRGLPAQIISKQFHFSVCNSKRDLDSYNPEHHK